jgi:hypothetical protein
MNRSSLFLTVLLACGLIVAGCGGDDDDGGGGDSVATTETAPATTTETEPTEAEASGDPADACVQHVEAQIDLVEQLEGEASDDVRSQLEATCDDVTSDEDVVDALDEMCRVVARETLPGDEAAVEACDAGNP